MNPPSPEEHPPWAPPSPDRGQQIWAAVQRYSFPAVVLLLIAGLGAAWYWQSNAPTPAEQEEARIQAAIEAYQSGQRPATQGGPDPLGMRSSSDDGKGGTITVRSRPAQATVRVDDDSVGVTPLTSYALDSGVYFITVERSGYAPADTLLIVRGGNAPSFTAVLERARPSRTPSRRQTPPRRTSPPPTRTESTGEANTAETNTDDAEGVVASPQVPDEIADDPAPATGSLQVVTDPAGATVLIDGQRVGITPLTVEALPAGVRGATLYRSGYDTVRTTVDVVAGADRTVRQTLTPRPGRLRVLVQPWGSVYVNGALRQRNTDVWFETTLPAGAHEVTAVHPALGRVTRQIDLPPGGEQSVVIDLRAAPASQADTTTGAPGDAGG